MDVRKLAHELSYWKSKHAQEHRFVNGHFRQIMMAMAHEQDCTFLKGKVVGDFGCGPRGSLVWAEEADLRIGIDVLADAYMDEFPEDLASHGMVYLKSTERNIPLPSRFLDCCFTLNAMDHVQDFSRMISEIYRVLKAGGNFIASFNINGQPTTCEPQALTENRVRTTLVSTGFFIESCMISNREDSMGDFYQSLISGRPQYDEGKEAFMWIIAARS